MMKSLRNTLAGLWSLLVGLNITRKNFFQPKITVHYPRKIVDSLEGYRGHIELVPREDDPFATKCVACAACLKICPSACISLTLKKPQSDAPPVTRAHPDMAGLPINLKKKHKHPAKSARELKTFQLNFNYCSLCGLCVQNCPAGAIRFSSDVFLAGFTRQEFEYDLLARLQRQAQSKQSQSGQ